MIEQLETGAWLITTTEAVNPVWWVAWNEGDEDIAYGETPDNNITTVGRKYADIFATEEDCKDKVLELGGEWQDEILDADYEVIE